MGDYLFKYRGQIPIILFLLIIPFILYNDYSQFTSSVIEKNKIVSFLFSFLGMIIRVYTVGNTPGGTSGRNRKKQIAKKLNTKGIYSISRNPLYFGNYLIWLGLSIYSLNTYYTILISIFFFIYYGEIVKTEEKYLLKKFGNKFLNWKNKTPRFFPSIFNYQKDEYSFSFKTVLKREYSSFLATIFSFFYIDILINFKLDSDNIIDKNLCIIFLISVLVTLILRNMKKNTTILDQKGRT